MPLGLFRKRKVPEVPGAPLITKEVLLKSKPVRNPELEWQRYPSGEVAIFVKREVKGFTKLVARAAKVEPRKKILLDKVGSFVWDLCDGEHTVEDIIRELMREYKLHRREAEASLLLYLQMLSKRALIGFILPARKGGQPSAPEEAHG